MACRQHSQNGVKWHSSVLRAGKHSVRGCFDYRPLEAAYKYFSENTSLSPETHTQLLTAQ